MKIKQITAARVFLFLAAFIFALHAQHGWASFITLANGYTQCDILSGVSGYPGGMVVLADGTVLVADTGDGVYAIKPGFPCGFGTSLIGPKYLYYGMAIGSDGNVYANDYPFRPGGTGDLYIIDPATGTPISIVLKGVYGLGMAVDPLTGDLYVSRCQPGVACPGPDIRRITGLYGSNPPPPPLPFVAVPGQTFDGLAWSCDGTRLASASQADAIYEWNRKGVIQPNFPIKVPSNTRPDGIAFGKEGTAFGGYFFVSNETGSVSKIKNDGSTYNLIASNGKGGDFVSVDNQGNLLVTQAAGVTKLSSTTGGQWVLPGSGLCADLSCGAKAVTTDQVDRQPCFAGDEGLYANLILTLSQSACTSCAECYTLNQTRSTLKNLLDVLDPPKSCLDDLKRTLESLTEACQPCNQTNCSQPAPCSNCIPSLPGAVDLQVYDPTLQAFMRKIMSPK